MYYLQLNPDVRQVYGSDNVEGAIAHYTSYGIKEGRDPSPFFSPKYYLAQHSDVSHAFGGDNYTEALNHWLRYGITEGRRGSRHFDVKFYLSTHPDLVRAYGADGYQLAFEHWKRWGNAEGRKTANGGGMGVSYYLGQVEDIDRNRGDCHGLVGFAGAGEAGATFEITPTTIGSVYRIAGVLLTVHAITSLVMQEHHRAKMKKLREELQKGKELLERERFRELDRRNYESERIERYRDIAFV